MKLNSFLTYKTLYNIWEVAKKLPGTRKLVHMLISDQKSVQATLKLLAKMKGEVLRVKGLDIRPLSAISDLRGLSSAEAETYALMTGRAIVLENQHIIEGLKQKIDLREFPDSFINYINNEVIRAINSKKDKYSNINIELILAEEYLHWKILKGTSLLVLIDGLSWAIRIQQIALANAFFKTTNFPKKFNKDREPLTHEQTLNCIRKYDNNVERMKSFSTMLARYIKNLDLLYAYLAPEITVFVEPVTWALLKLEQNLIEDRFRTYFKINEDRSIAKKVYYEARKCLEKKSSDYIIMQANKALDVPSNIIAQHVSRRQRLSSIIADRFTKLCHNEAIETSALRSKTNLSSWLTAIDSIDNESWKMISNVLLSNSQLLAYIIDIATTTSEKKIYNMPSVFIFDKNEETYIYDPLTGIIITPNPNKTKVPVVRGLEEIIGAGDLPLTFRGFIMRLHKMIIAPFSKEDFEDKISSLSYQLGISKEKLEKLFNDTFDDMYKTFGWKASDFMYFNPDVNKLNNDEYIRKYQRFTIKFFKSWAYVICRLGYLSEKALGGLHGLYR